MLQERQYISHYRILGLLGRGGMGVVYLAEDLHVERQVAIKVIRTDPALYANAGEVQDAIRLFRREANAVAMLDHPHILPLYECGEEDLNGTPCTYLVMPYRPEGSLADVLQRLSAPKRLLPSDVMHIVQQAADALQHAHAHNIIHRDVKPSNFLLRNRYENAVLPDLLLTDFGIAKLNTTSEKGPSTTIRGTATYMAPEQWTDCPEPATDQYALAIMAYELLTGRAPFLGNQQQLMYQHFHVQPSPPSTFNPNISQDVDAVILRALAKTPADRFPSISAFSHAIQEAVLHPNQVVSLANSQTIADTVPVLDPPNFDPTNNGAKIKPDRGRIRAKSLLLLAIVILFIASGFGLYYGVDIRQNEIEHTDATMTAIARYTAFSRNVTGTAQSYATATSQAQITATAQAITNATATAQVSATAAIRSAYPNPYSPYGGTLTHFDPLSDNSQGNSWDQGGNCTFTGGAYHASESQKGYFNACIAQNTSFSNFVYEAQMTIISGDCGALIFRADGSNGKYYYFRICQDGTYALIRYDSFNSTGQLLQSDSSPAFTTGLNQSNVIAVVAIGDTIDLYVNHQKLLPSVNDSSYSQGQIGVAADSPSNPTEVVFSNVRVWTW
jgi:serine/threonine protein kinase